MIKGTDDNKNNLFLETRLLMSQNKSSQVTGSQTLKELVTDPYFNYKIINEHEAKMKQLNDKPAACVLSEN